ncbi:hypothetical protein O9992_04000 [Vibrio lentus]|nr:hypothetical protein [Vibrio lentus]
MQYHSFLIAAPLNKAGHKLYQQSGKWLKNTLLRSSTNATNELIQVAQVLILGMGRIGTGAYDELRSRYGKEFRCRSTKTRHITTEAMEETSFLAMQLTQISGSVS